MSRVRQHSKGRKRPRAWHLGRQQGAINERLLTSVVEPAFAAAEADLQAVKARADAHRDELRRARKDDQELLRQLGRVAPFVPRWEISL